MNPVEVNKVLRDNFVYKIVHQQWRIIRPSNEELGIEQKVDWPTQITIYQAVINENYVEDEYDSENPQTHMFLYLEKANVLKVNGYNFESDCAEITLVMLGKIDLQNLPQHDKFNPDLYTAEGFEVTRIHQAKWERYVYGRDTGASYSDPYNDIRTRERWEIEWRADMDRGEWLTETGCGGDLWGVTEVYQKLTKYREGHKPPTYTQAEQETIVGFEVFGHVFGKISSINSSRIHSECISGTFVNDYADGPDDERDYTLTRGEYHEPMASYHQRDEIYTIGKKLYCNGEVLIGNINTFINDYLIGNIPVASWWVTYMLTESGGCRWWNNLLNILTEGKATSYHSKNGMSCSNLEADCYNDGKPVELIYRAITKDFKVIEYKHSVTTKMDLGSNGFDKWYHDNASNMLHCNLLGIANITAHPDGSGKWVATDYDASNHIKEAICAGLHDRPDEVEAALAKINYNVARYKK